jgi:hypothetical protein
MCRTLQALALLTALVLGLGAAGCGPRGRRLAETGATLEGTITYGKDKVPLAEVTVMGANAMATGTVGEDGRYRVENVPLGEVTIGVNTDAARGELQSKIMAQSYRGPEAKGRTRAAIPKMVDVPRKYAELETSDIKTTVSKGVNTFDIVIPR